MVMYGRCRLQNCRRPRDEHRDGYCPGQRDQRYCGKPSSGVASNSFQASEIKLGLEILRTMATGGDPSMLARRQPQFGSLMRKFLAMHKSASKEE